MGDAERSLDRSWWGPALWRGSELTVQGSSDGRRGGKRVRKEMEGRARSASASKRVHFDLPSRTSFSLSSVSKRLIDSFQNPFRRPTQSSSQSKAPAQMSRTSPSSKAESPHLRQPRVDPERQSRQSIKLFTSHPIPAHYQRLTIHIITYALSRAPTTTHAKRIFSSRLPEQTPHLYTIHAEKFNPVPHRLHEGCNGVSEVIQKHLKKDRRVMRAIKSAVLDLLDWRAREKKQAKKADAKNKKRGGKCVALSVCCIGGRYRSVAVAEMIAKDLRGYLGQKIEVKIDHVHLDGKSRNIQRRVQEHTSKKSSGANNDRRRQHGSLAV